ncbi:MAG: A/G-specific adenine glycosylase [Eubacteriales bacterium]
MTTPTYHLDKAVLAQQAERLRPMVEPLLAWYRAHQRDLPWRQQKSPYSIWVSEIMLQQTRVETVKPYYQNFMAALPTTADLAAAEEGLLLKLWEGLGYYSRVRNMQKAARTVMQEYGGRLPADEKELKKLCGIGSYTAGAIASIAYGIPSPAVDGNVLRLVARLLADDRNVLDAQVKSDTEVLVRALIPPDAAGDFTQALIELGALVCLPGGGALCESCPVSGYCAAKAGGLSALLPTRISKTKRRHEQRTVLLLCFGDKVALRRRTEKGLLEGLWELPAAEGHLDMAQVKAYCEQRGLSATDIQALPPAKHVFTHLTWHMIGYRVQVMAHVAPAPTSEAGKDLLFVSPEALRKQYALPSAFAAYLKLLSPAADKPPRGENGMLLKGQPK